MRLAIPAGTVLDGELVCWTEGRLDFAALLRRHGAGRRVGELAVVQPCHYVAFDVLELAGVDHRPKPLVERRAVLDELIARVVQPSPVTAAMYTTDPAVALEWFERLWQVGVEGLVLKPADGSYRPGDKSSWLKYKRHTDTPVIVAGITGTPARPGALIVARYASADGECGRPGGPPRWTPARPPSSHTCLPRPEMGIRGRSGCRRAGSAPCTANRQPLEYTRVDPTLVVDVQVDAAAHDGRWRHVLRYLRARTDLTPDQVPLDLDYD